VALASLESALDDIERWSRLTAPADVQLTRLRQDLPAAYQAASADIIASLRAQLHALAAELRLDGTERSVARATRATLTAQVVRLDDCYAAKLGGYGKVNPDVAKRLDPAVRGLQDGLLELLRLFHPDQEGDG
jgi:hypothetical protein